MRHYHCANHSAFSLQPSFKHCVHNMGNFEAYFDFANISSGFASIECVELLLDVFWGHFLLFYCYVW